MVTQGLFPQPCTIAELRATFPARVTDTRRARVSSRLSSGTAALS